MRPDQIHKLLGGYATGTLTAEERQALFEAALEDQQLFDALAREQSLRDLLGDPAAKAQLLAALGEAPATWRQRAARWMWGHAVGVAAVACLVAMAGYMFRQARFTPPRVMMVATQPTTVDVTAPRTAPTPPRRVFDLNSVRQAAARPPEMPAPPFLRPPLQLAQLMPPALSRGIGGGYAAIPQPAAGAASPLDTGANPTQHFEPAMDTIAEVRPAAVGAAVRPPQLQADAGQGGDATSSATAVPGTLTGTIVDSSNAAVPGAQIEVGNLTTGAVRRTVSGPDGVFVVNGLSPSKYSLTARAAGFRPLDTGNLDVTASASLNLGHVRLSLGAVPESIVVTAAATPLRTASSENAKLVNGPLRSTSWKLDPALVALQGRAHNGEARVRMTLTNASADSLAQLRRAGFIVTRQERNQLTGRIAVAKLAAVAQLAFVVWIAPQ
jgi:hypothetical protein